MVTKADISLVRSLADKRSREQHGLFVVEGRKMVGEAMASAMAVSRIFATGEYAHVDNCEVVSRKDIERMSSLRTPQGILAVVETPHYAPPGTPGERLTIALDGVQDPGNLGTIMRIADWFGIDDVLCSPDTADPFGPKAVQASMGAIFRVRTHAVDLPSVISIASDGGIPVYGAFLEGDNIYETRLEGERGLIILGSEGNGIGERVSAMVTKKLYIPPFPAGKPGSESLNVGVAAAIVCSEFRRRSKLGRH